MGIGRQSIDIRNLTRINLPTLSFNIFLLYKKYTNDLIWCLCSERMFYIVHHLSCFLSKWVPLTVFLIQLYISNVQMSLVTGKSVFDVFDQVRPACAATEDSERLEILDTETRDIILSRQRKTKVLIRLCECVGWCEPLLFAYGINRLSCLIWCLF